MDERDDDPATLFAPRGTDRSPAAWAARLFPAAAPAPLPSPVAATPAPPVVAQTATPEGTPAPQPSSPTPPINRPQRAAAPAPTATPLTEGTRRFLAPLVGVDPATVRVYRGAAAAEFAADHDADAVAIGDTIALGAGHDTDSPATLGVLAHELTHVARNRTPRFVPPVARDEGVRRTAGPTLSPTTDEEAVARRVEVAVARTARTRQQGDEEPGLGISFLPPSDHAGGEAAEEMPPLHVALSERNWGGLPAPWEPLPNWLATPAPTAGPSAASPVSNAPTAPSAPPPAPIAAVAQRAESGRQLPGNTEAAGSQHQEAKPPEIDLDALARQVYGVLKRRLATEDRRGV